MRLQSINIVVIIVTLMATIASVTYRHRAVFAKYTSTISLQSFYDVSYLETTLTAKFLQKQQNYCQQLLRIYHRSERHEWLANIAHCYDILAKHAREQQQPEIEQMAISTSQEIVTFGLQSVPDDVALILLAAQHALRMHGIQSTEFRAALLKARSQAPRHRTTLWLAAAEAYYRGERSQALAYLTQLREQVGDNPEIMNFINAVKALPDE